MQENTLLRKENPLPANPAEIQPIQAVENALDLMEALADEEREEVQLADLAQQLGMSKTKIFRLLATLENRGYVEKGARAGRYRLGPTVYDLGPKALGSMKLLQAARPSMRRLAGETDEAVYLGLKRGEEVLFLDFVDTTQQVRGVSLLCRRYPLDGTAAGLVIIPPHLNHCMDRDALGVGLSSLAVPVFHGPAGAAGSLCLAGPSFRLPPQRLEELLPRLQEAARVISSKQGHVEHLRKCS